MKLPELNENTPANLGREDPLLAIAAILRKNVSGTLRLKSGKVVRLLQFHQRHLVGASSNAKSELPGTLLHNEGVLDTAKYNQFLKTLTQKGAKPWDVCRQLAGLSDGEWSEKRKDIQLQIAKAAVDSAADEIVFQPQPISALPAFAAPAVALTLAVSAEVPIEKLSSVVSVLKPSSFVSLPREIANSKDDLPLDPEERGLLSVAENNETVADVFESSFLGQERITRMLCAYWLCGYLNLEDAEEARLRKHEETLTQEQRNLRNELIELHRKLESATYYEFIGVSVDSSAEEILRNVQSAMEKYAAPGVENLLMDSEKDYQEKVLTRIQDARAVLTHDSKRKEYDAFIESGGSSSFVESSISIKTEEYLQKGKVLLNAGKIAEAAQLYRQATEEVPEEPVLSAAYLSSLLRFGEPTAEMKNQALQEIQRALSLKNKSPEVFHSIGDWLKVLQQPKKAAEAYSNALRLQPGSVAVRKALMDLDPKSGRALVIKVLARCLPEANYYQLLGIEKDANAGDVHFAYRNATKYFHPDRFFQEGNEALKSHAKEVYKRMIDAYMTLKNPAKRKRYDQMQAGKTKATGATFRPAGTKGSLDYQKEKDFVAASDLVPPKTRQGKKFYELAMTALRQGKKDSAKLNLELGLQIEPDNNLMKQKLKELSSQRQ